MEQPRRKVAVRTAVIAIFAMVLLSQTLSRPSMAGIRLVDVFGLVLPGLLLGLALAHAIQLLRKQRRSRDGQATG